MWPTKRESASATRAGFCEMKPQKRRYQATGSTMTEVGLDPGLFRDLYLAMGEPLEGQAWAMRVHFKPFVRWIWLGAIFMALGAVMAVADKRYRRIKFAQTSTAMNGSLATSE